MHLIGSLILDEAVPPAKQNKRLKKCWRAFEALVGDTVIATRPDLYSEDQVRAILEQQHRSRRSVVIGTADKYGILDVLCDCWDITMDELEVTRTGRMEAGETAVRGDDKTQEKKKKKKKKTVKGKGKGEKKDDDEEGDEDDEGDQTEVQEEEEEEEEDEESSIFTFPFALLLLVLLCYATTNSICLSSCVCFSMSVCLCMSMYTYHIVRMYAYSEWLNLFISHQTVQLVLLRAWVSITHGVHPLTDTPATTYICTCLLDMIAWCMCNSYIIDL